MNNASDIFLSILIPTWNRCESVLDAVKSAGPEADDVEVIVVDDGSDEAIARRLHDGLRSFSNVKLFWNAKNFGMAGNWNKCISHASGQWMGILCDDDVYYERAIERALSIMRSMPEPVLIVQDPSLDVDVLRCASGRETVATLRLPILAGNFWHRKIVEELGGFNERFIYSADAEYWPRIAARFPVVKVKAPFAEYKKHATNYMWKTWREPDFLEQTEALARTVASYTDEDAKTIEKKTDDSLWSTVLTIISSSFMEKDKMDIFLKYFPEILKRARSMKRKFDLIRRLFLSLASRFRRSLIGGG